MKITIETEITDADRWAYVLENMVTYPIKDADEDVVGYGHVFEIQDSGSYSVIEHIDEQILNQRFEEARK